MLVGHSYGGNVISLAPIGDDQLQALVYFNGWMCEEGESQQLLLERFDVPSRRRGDSRQPLTSAGDGPVVPGLTIPSFVTALALSSSRRHSSVSTVADLAADRLGGTARAFEHLIIV